MSCHASVLAQRTCRTTRSMPAAESPAAIVGPCRRSGQAVNRCVLAGGSFVSAGCLRINALLQIAPLRCVNLETSRAELE